MGLFGGDSSSSSSNFYDQSKKNVEGLATGAIGVASSGSGSVTLNTLDGGAVAGAFDLVKSNDAYNNRNYEALLKTTGATLKDILGASSDSMSGILSGVASTQNFIASTQATAKGTLDSRTLMVLGLAVAGVLGIYFMKGRA